MRVTRAKAQNPQNTKACARPGKGRWRMTLAWHITSQTKSQTRLPMGKRWKSASFFESRMRLRMGPKRCQKSQSDARMSTAKAAFSAREKCWGSASVRGNETIAQSLTIHDGGGGRL